MFPVIWWIGKGSRKAAHLQLAVVAADFCGGKSAFEGQMRCKSGNPPQTLPFNEKTPVTFGGVTTHK
jgi:hypothetical protein